MTEHLPECWAKDPSDPPAWCICDELRACEERCDEKRHAEVRAWSELSRDNFDDGFAAGLDAAREAVLGARSLDVASGHMVDGQARFVWMNHALEAIDALKEKS